MPIKINNLLPAKKQLESENIFVMTDDAASRQDIRPLKIVILNLMPTKIETETQLLRLLGNTPLQVEVDLMQISSRTTTHVSSEHMLAFYKSFSRLKNKRYDGMIITGAPVERMPFENVDYWGELCEIMDWSRTNVFSTFHICWGAQAGLYRHYGIRKELLPKKLSGVYCHTILTENHPLFRGFDDFFFAPHSRYTGVCEEDIHSFGGLDVLAVSEQAGIYAAADKCGRAFYITGHCEYDRDTLKKEYERDQKAGMEPEIPQNYFKDNNPKNVPQVRWRGAANLLFYNWLNYFVYQATPYDLDKL